MMIRSLPCVVLPRNVRIEINKAKKHLVSVRSVESSDIYWRRKRSGGIKIICQSEMRDFSAMAFITDHVNTLIEQWFPGQCSSLSNKHSTAQPRQRPLLQAWANCGPGATCDP